jgi:hypothetical protein
MAASALDANAGLFEGGSAPAGGPAAPVPAPTDAPSWVSAAQRYVEQQSLQLQRDVRDDDDDVTGRVSSEVERTLAKLQSIVGGVATGGLK